MKNKMLKQHIKRRKVKFSIDAAGAAQVSLMGDFNKWDPNVHPMKNDGGGIWNRTLMIPMGIYEYKFFIDGEWKEDPRNEQTRLNCFGTFNSVLNLS